MKNNLVLSVAALLYFTASSFAGVIYTNLGPGDSYSGGSYTAESPTLPFSDASRFIATTTGTLADVLVPVGDDPNGVLTFGLYDNSGGQPGTLLESWTNVTVPTSPFSLSLLDLGSVVHPVLSAGSQYWFVATSDPITVPGSFGLFWAASNEVTSGGIWGSTDFGPFTHEFGDSAAVAIQLDSTVPEPGTWALMGCGILGLAFRRMKNS